MAGAVSPAYFFYHTIMLPIERNVEKKPMKDRSAGQEGERGEEKKGKKRGKILSDHLRNLSFP